MRAAGALPLCWWLSLLLPGSCLRRQSPAPGQGAAPLPQAAGVPGQYGPPPGAGPQPPFQQGLPGQYGPPPGFEQGVPGQYGPPPGFEQGGQWWYPQMVQDPYGQVPYGMPPYMPPPYAQSPYGQGAFAPAPYAPPPPAGAGAWPPAGAAAPPAAPPRGTLPPPPTMDGLEHDGKVAKFIEKARGRIANDISDKQQTLHNAQVRATGQARMVNTLSSLLTGESVEASMKQSVGGTLSKLGSIAAVNTILGSAVPKGAVGKRIAMQAISTAGILKR